MAENIQPSTSGVVGDENCEVRATDQPRKRKKEWNDLIRESRYKPSPFSMINTGKETEWFLMDESLKSFFLKNPKPKISQKPARMYGVSPQYPGQVLVRQSYHGPWTFHTIAGKRNSQETALEGKSSDIEIISDDNSSGE
ncbi:unnamed protein product [Psylliodes chrysocephalus]|uniref:Uncharacterized protein n=1 Tax=Psylliodes chrysocephalus TaxID=3402493 RepID=A0A9P0CGV8_9CUCU|nr:unnamed protein product [Psylliodes chrysocephala]